MRVTHFNPQKPKELQLLSGNMTAPVPIDDSAWSEQVDLFSRSPGASKQAQPEETSSDDGNISSFKESSSAIKDILITSPNQTTSVTKDISITSPDQPPSRKRVRDSDCSDESPTIKHIVRSTALFNLKSQDLRDVFKENIITENILSKYESTGILTEYDRAHIVERAVQYLLQLNPRPSQQEQALLAEKNCHVFNFEETTSYYVAPSSTCKNATSKIPNKIRNIRYSLKKRMDGAPVKFDFSAHSNKDGLTKLAGSCDKEDEDVLTALLALTHENTPSPQ
ncbi:uncharacterized protein LOC127751299 isoform X2 [Frankliniella occidentalis]|nr:uncharacterized protein LOC127751299 isoform X2 [Frankliniella occidentalis]XP_052130578.1 uncharacterized protein LOC127751299 isoform X2 [Frankliniella occidentalis]